MVASPCVGHLADLAPHYCANPDTLRHAQEEKDKRLLDNTAKWIQWVLGSQSQYSSRDVAHIEKLIASLLDNGVLFDEALAQALQNAGFGSELNWKKDSVESE